MCELRDNVVSSDLFMQSWGIPPKKRSRTHFLRVVMTGICKIFQVYTSSCSTIFFQVVYWASVLSRGSYGVTGHHHVWLSVQYISIHKPGISRLCFHDMPPDTAGLHPNLSRPHGYNSASQQQVWVNHGSRRGMRLPSREHEIYCSSV